jgi:uncharacterized phiE125 gp8 family phage protein
MKKYEIQVKTDVSTEPVSVAEAKNYLKLPTATTTDDTILETLISAAREQVENYIGQALAVKTLIYQVNECDGESIYLPYPPHTSVSSVKRVYYDETDDETLTVNDDYYVNGLNEYVVDIGKTWSTSATTTVTGYKIEFICGYGGDGEDLPGTLKEAVLMTIDYNYYNRGDGVTLPPHVKDMLQGFRKNYWI